MWTEAARRHSLETKRARAAAKRKERGLPAHKLPPGRPATMARDVIAKIVSELEEGQEQPAQAWQTRLKSDAHTLYRKLWATVHEAWTHGLEDLL